MAVEPEAVTALAREMLAALDSVQLVTPPTARTGAIDFAYAYAVAEQAAQLRGERGEQAVGRKIGYTNRALWEPFNVHQPIWGYMYAHTVHEAPSSPATISLSGMIAPRVEPEIAFRLRSAPPTGCTEPAAMLECIEWVARSFEIVDCHYADWKFQGPDSVIDFGHHAALVVGEQLPVRSGEIAWLADALRDCRVTLTRDGGLVDSGIGANALDHPALALACLADVIATQPEVPPLSAGDIITTGTLTMAPFIKQGETWKTETDGLPLPPLTVKFE